MIKDQVISRLGVENNFVYGYRKRKQRPIESKEDAPYGVFACASSDGYDEGAYSRKRREGSKSTAYSTKPVRFVQSETVMPSEAGKKIKGFEKSRDISKLSDKIKSDFFGSNVGSFEKYNKGIGMKLMEKMGYKGGGLGKEEQGSVAPIEAKLRPKNMGMGFNDYQESMVLPKVKVSEQESDEKQPVARMKENFRKKDIRARAKKGLYVTAEDLLAMRAKPVIQKIVDMRGPHIRVLTSLENLNAEETAEESHLPMPELQHNIRLMMELTDLERQELGRKLRNEQQTAFVLQQEKEKLQQQQLHNMEEIEKVLDNVKEENSLGILELESLAKYFEDLHRMFPDDYKLCKLSSIAYSYALPLFIRTFQGWDPLRNPSHGSNLFLLWKNLLQGEECFDYSGATATSLYSELVVQVVLPTVRRSGINSWQARDPEPMLRFVEHWEDLLPSSVREQILDMVVLPKLSEAVHSWDPCRETIPIHAWIHPWLPLLPEKLESLKQAILVKLGFALRAWHPSDNSAFTILDPWKTMFDPASWERLIARYILPKLDQIMQDFDVNPADQKLDQFNWVMKWASAIPIRYMADLLERRFFRKWHQVLHLWLTSEPDFGEVAQWYCDWKALLPPELAANQCIQIQLNKALFMMNQAVDDEPSLTRHTNLADEPNIRYSQRQTSKGIYASQTDEELEMSLIEVIAAYANECDVLFMPKPGRFHDGLQIHGFGHVSIIADSPKQMIYAQAGDKWCLVSLEQLTDMQNVSVSRRR